MYDTHTVTNQPPPLAGYNLFLADPALTEGVTREGAGDADGSIAELGALAGTEEAIALGFDANENPPQLHSHDRYGNRIDEVTFHPSWHRLMETATRFGLHATPWRATHVDAHVARAAKFFIWSQVESGYGCPISMTYASVPALRNAPELAALWEPRLTATLYDGVLRPVERKASALCGMAMTEKQGGSDVRTNQTRARFFESTPLGDAYLLTGHKWFCSAPMNDAFLVLAQTDDGLTCFFMPRFLPDGTRNRIFITRLKDKLGNRSNASSEIELADTWAIRVGLSGRGIQTIVEMVNYTRLDCINGSASLMRQAVAQATHHAAYRYAFGKPLLEQPLMRNVLADLALESEAATTLLLRLARSVDQSAQNEHEAAIKRIGTALGKYWVCKRTPALVAEALESLGGNGYVEESILPRLYREAPLNSIWEGSGNVNALDILRVFEKHDDAFEALRVEFAPVAHEPRIRTALTAVESAVRSGTSPSGARRFAERLALIWQGALLLAHAPGYVSDAFLASRLAGDGGHAFGTLPESCDLAAIVDRARPEV